MLQGTKLVSVNGWYSKCIVKLSMPVYCVSICMYLQVVGMNWYVVVSPQCNTNHLRYIWNLVSSYVTPSGVIAALKYLSRLQHGINSDWQLLRKCRLRFLEFKWILFSLIWINWFDLNTQDVQLSFDCCCWNHATRIVQSHCSHCACLNTSSNVFSTTGYLTSVCFLSILMILPTGHVSLSMQRQPQTHDSLGYGSQSSRSAGCRGDVGFVTSVNCSVKQVPP